MYIEDALQEINEVFLPPKKNSAVNYGIAIIVTP